MKHSRQRDLICTAIQQLGHPTAEEIYTRLKPEHPSLSLGTVYRNLRQLEEQNILLSVPRKTGGSCFDGNPEEHGHLSCVRCGRIEDLPPFPFTQLDNQLERQFSFTPLRHDFIVYGLCAACRAEDEQQKSSAAG